MRAVFFVFLTTALPLAAQDRLRVSVQWDWVRLPHAAANELIHRHLKHSRDAEALRQAVEAMIREKQAVRIDVQGIAVDEGSRGKLDTALEKSYPTEFNQSRISHMLTVQGPNPPAVEAAPAVPASFTFRKLGRMAEVEVSLTEDGQSLDVQFHPQWTEHLGDLSYGQGVSEVKQPVFYNAECSARLLLTSGVWQLAGLFTPPPEAAKDVKPELAPLPGDRVLLFVKASAPGLPAKAPVPGPDDPDQVMVFAEWIETDLNTAAELLTAHPDYSLAAALREAVGRELAAGRAMLVESTIVPCRLGERSTIHSGREVPYPTNFDAGQMPQALTLKAPAPAAAVPPGTYAPWVTPATPGSFTFRLAGVMMEADCALAASGDRVSVSVAPVINNYVGKENFGLGPALSTQPRFQELKSFAAGAILLPGTPALIATLDGPQTGDALPGSARARKMMLFVTVIH
jgi:hypothetical protein